MGRKRKPDALKLVEGTFTNHRANPDAPVATDSKPTPPTWLEAAAVPHFETLVARLDEIGVASETDTEVIALAATRLAEIEACSRYIKARGRTVKTAVRGGGFNTRSSPVVGQRSDAMRHLQSLLAEFGLTPAARSRVTAKKDTPKPSAFTKRSQPKRG